MADVVREINRESGAVGGGSVSKTLEISVVKVGVSGDVARTMVIDFGRLQAQPTWGSIQGKPTFADVAFSGSYNDLSDKPVGGNVKSVQFDTSTFDDLNVGDTVYEGGWCASVSEKSDVYLRLTSADSMSARDIIYEKQNGEWVETTDYEISFENKAEKPQQFVEGHIATFDENGDLSDGGPLQNNALTEVRYNSKGLVLQQSKDGENYTDIVSVNTLKVDMQLNMLENKPQVTREEMGVANGVATLDAQGKVPQSQMPNVAITVDSELSSTSENPVQNKVVKSAIDAKYTKPSGGIPSSDIASGVIPDVSGFITKSVNDLTNYYLKSETYTKAEVAALIRAIQQFHYEIYATLPQSGESNVLYLIGPTGSGSDKYEEYVYKVTRPSGFVKIGDTSIDLSGYVATRDLNRTLEDYVATSDLNRTLEDYVTTSVFNKAFGGLATVATSGDYDDLTNKPTIPTVPTNVSAFTNDVGYLTQHQSLTNYVQKSQTSGLLKNDGTVDTTQYGTYSKPSGGIPASDLASGVIPQPEVFWAEYGVTTITEILAELASGKLVVCRNNDVVYLYSHEDTNNIYFHCSVMNNAKYIRISKTNQTWYAGAVSLENTEYRVGSWRSTPDNSHYPSEKLVKDSIDAVDKVFWATYGTTTAAEVDAAVAAGKIVMCKYDDKLFTLAHYKSSDLFVYFGGIYATNAIWLRILRSNNTWANGIDSLQLLSNKVSTISGNETNTTKYPNTKATYDAIHPAVETTQQANGMLPNVMYNLGTLSGNTTFTLATPADANIVNHYYWTFDTPSTAPTITWPQAITDWNGGSAPTINASKHYEVSVLDGIGVIMEV